MSNTFIEQIAELRERPKRAQRGGVRRGFSWTRQAGWRFTCGMWMDVLQHRQACFMDALTIIANHSRKPSTVAEARRLLGVIDG